VEYPLAEEIEALPPIHCSFDELQPIDVTLNLRIAPHQGQPCSHRRFIREQT
jgi:hypothetical protein